MEGDISPFKDTGINGYTLTHATIGHGECRDYVLGQDYYTYDKSTIKKNGPSFEIYVKRICLGTILMSARDEEVG
jgi:hypothetical protein